MRRQLILATVAALLLAASVPAGEDPSPPPPEPPLPLRIMCYTVITLDRDYVLPMCILSPAINTPNRRYEV